MPLIPNAADRCFAKNNALNGPDSRLASSSSSSPAALVVTGLLTVCLRSERARLRSLEREGHRMDRTRITRLAFCIAAALIAAALGDAVVESVSNTGVLGGRYNDNNHLGIVPTLHVGTVLLLGMLVLRFIEVLTRSTNSSQGSFIDAARELTPRSLVQYLPYVFALQLMALFVLESVEQLAVDGKLLGGTEWLGGPIFFSLITHALIGACCTFALGASIRAIVRTFALIVRTAIRFIWLAIASATGGKFYLNRRDALCRRAQEPCVCQIGGRAPPFLQALA
jgi:hypothetical protein